MIDFRNQLSRTENERAIRRTLMTQTPRLDKPRLSRRQALIHAASAALACSLATPRPARAQGAPLRIVVGYPPGGASDRAARIVADRLKDLLGSPVIVENRPGAGGRLAAQQLRGARADDNVLMLGNPAVMVVAPVVFKDNGYNPTTDFVPVAHVNDYEFAIAVSAAVPVREFSHLAAWLRVNPEKANFGVPATGSLPHFFGLMVGDAMGLKPEIVGYKGSAPMLQDLIGGQIPVGIDTLDTLEPQHRGGKLRILAVSSEKRSVLAPDLPTFRESGLSVAATGFGVLFAPASAPPARVQSLGDAVAKIMAEPEVRARFTDLKLIPVAANAQRAAAMLKAYRAQWEPVVQRSGFTA
jgi:tripartite-type tricarboxylate transporter receptor subunit TctC